MIHHFMFDYVDSTMRLSSEFEDAYKIEYLKADKVIAF